MLRLPHYLDKRLTDGGEVVSLTRRQPFTPQEDSCYSFLLQAESTPGPYCGWNNQVDWKIQWPHRELKLRPPVCSIVSELTTLEGFLLENLISIQNFGGPYLDRMSPCPNNDVLTSLLNCGLVWNQCWGTNLKGREEKKPACPMLSIIQAFSWKKLRKPRQTSIRILGSLIYIWTRNLQNTKRKWNPLRSVGIPTG
jgi:hypothetical protein